MTHTPALWTAFCLSITTSSPHAGYTHDHTHVQASLRPASSQEVRCDSSLTHLPATMTRRSHLRRPSFTHRRPPRHASKTPRKDTPTPLTHGHLPNNNLVNPAFPTKDLLRNRSQTHYRNRLLHTPGPHKRRRRTPSLLSGTQSVSPRQTLQSMKIGPPNPEEPPSSLS